MNPHGDYIFHINVNNTVYKIPLDVLDLNFLAINGWSNRFKDYVKPLCSLNQREYFEFELTAEMREDEKRNWFDYSIQSTNSDSGFGSMDLDRVHDHFEVCKCYICNIDVPRIYFNEHIASDKHRSYTNIANNALERIRKHMNDVIICNTDNKVESVYFCSSCVVVISDANKGKHENSKAHIASVEHDKLLKELSNIYTKEIDLNLEISNEINKDYGNHSNKANAYLEIKKEIDANSKQKNTKLKIEKETDKHTDGLNKTKDITKVSCLLPYIKMITEKINTLHSVSAVDDNFIQIKTENGAIVKINIDNFHSYSDPVDSNDKLIKYCHVCNLFLKSRVREGHKTTIEHIKNVMLPLKDEDCIRKLAGIWSQCLLCNERVATVDVNNHISNQNHNELKEKALVTKTYNNYCNKITEFEAKIGITSDENDKVKDLRFIRLNKNEKQTVIVTEDPNKHGLNEYIKFISDKVRSKHELTAVNEMLLEIRATNGDRVNVNIDNFHSYDSNKSNYAYCFLCSVHLYGDNIKKHKYFMEHIKKIMTTIMDIHCLRQFENGCHCMICNVIINKSSYGIYLHTQSQDHCNLLKKAFTTTPETLVSEEINVKSNITVFPSVTTRNKEVAMSNCDACDQNIQSHNMKSHIGGNKHKLSQNIKAQAAETQKRKQELIVPATEINIVADWVRSGKSKKTEITNKTDLYEYLKFLDNRIPAENTLTAFNDSTVEVKTATGERLKIHKDKFHGYVRRGLQKICLLCLETLSENDEEHKIGINHIENITNPINDKHCIRQMGTNASHCLLCNKVLLNNMISDHIKNKEHNDLLTGALIASVNIPIVLDQNKNNTLSANINKSTTHCDVCNIDIDTHNMNSHANGNKHKLNMKSNFTENKGKKETTHYLMRHTTDSNHLICQVCNVKVPKNINNVNEHIKGLMHETEYSTMISKNKLTKSGKTYICEVCKVEVTVTSTVLHVNDENHRCKLNYGYLLELSSEINIVICKICKVKVPNNTFNVTQHVKGSFHEEGYKSFITENILTKIGNQYFCEVCKVNIDVTGELIHTNSDDHKRKLSFCETCQVTVSIKNMAAHVAEKMHKEIDKSATVTKTPATLPSYLCGICKVQVMQNPYNVKNT